METQQHERWQVGCVACERLDEDAIEGEVWVCDLGHVWEPVAQEGPAEVREREEDDGFTDQEALDISMVLLAAAHDARAEACNEPECAGCQALERGWDALYRTLSEDRRAAVMTLMVEEGITPPGMREAVG